MRSKADKSAYDKARYQANPQPAIERAKKRYRDDPEAKHAYDRARKPRKNKLRRAQYARDPEQFLVPLRKAHRRRHLRQYGLTPAGFDLMLDSQNKRCACCGTAEPGGFNWCVDHDHVTGRIRSIVCVRCNTGIGLLGDTLAGIERALAYLHKHYDKDPK